MRRPGAPPSVAAWSRPLLRDGSVVTLRRAEPADAAALPELYDDLEGDDVRLRFFSPTADTDRVFSGSSTLPDVTVWPWPDGGWSATDVRAARWRPGGGGVHGRARAQGHGVGTLLLQRLAGIASADGSRRSSRTCCRTTTA